MTGLGLGFGAAPFYGLVTSIEALVLDTIPLPVACVQFPKPGDCELLWNVFPMDSAPPTARSRLNLLLAASELLRHYLVSTQRIRTKRSLSLILSSNSYVETIKT